MDKTFIFDSQVDSLDIKDEINERLIKAQSVTACLLANQGGLAELPNKIIYGVVWMVDELLEELEQLFKKLDKC